MPDSTTGPFRILIGAETFPPDVNGAAHFARDLAARLSRRGHTVHVVAPATSLRPETRVELCDGERIVVHRLRSLRWPLHDWLRFAPPWEVRNVIGRVLDDIRPDVVHVQSVINIGRGISIEARRRGIAVVATNHVMPENIVEFSGLPRTLHPALTRFGWNLTSHALEHADLVTSPTPFAARYLEQHTTIKTVVPVSCGIDLDRFQYSDKRPSGNRVLYVGRLDPEKKLETLLGAIALVPRHLPVRLDIVGDGSRRRALQRLTENLAITDRVVFHGRVDDRQLIELHQAATVFAMPSTAELQSIASLEAMACGTPLVLADAMALPHLVDQGRNGYLVKPENVGAFANAIETVLTLPPETYRAMRQHSRHRALEHDADRITARYEQLYRLARIPQEERIGADV